MVRFAVILSIFCTHFAVGLRVPLRRSNAPTKRTLLNSVHRVPRGGDNFWFSVFVAVSPSIPIATYSKPILRLVGLPVSSANECLMENIAGALIFAASVPLCHLLCTDSFGLAILLLNIENLNRFYTTRCGVNDTRAGDMIALVKDANISGAKMRLLGHTSQLLALAQLVSFFSVLLQLFAPRRGLFSDGLFNTLTSQYLWSSVLFGVVNLISLALLNPQWGPCRFCRFVRLEYLRISIVALKTLALGLVFVLGLALSVRGYPF